MRAVIIAVVLVWAFAAEVAGGEITIGRWCDRMIPNIPKYDSILAIFITSDGKVILKSRLQNSDRFGAAQEHPS